MRKKQSIHRSSYFWKTKAYGSSGWEKFLAKSGCRESIQAFVWSTFLIKTWWNRAAGSYFEKMQFHNCFQVLLLSLPALLPVYHSQKLTYYIFCFSKLSCISLKSVSRKTENQGSYRTAEGRKTMWKGCEICRNWQTRRLGWLMQKHQKIRS